MPLTEAVTQEDQAIATYAQHIWLLGEVRQVLEPFCQPDQLMAVATARQIVETALAVLDTLPGESLYTLAQQLHDYLAALLTPLAWLEQTLAPYRQDLNPATDALILWAWRHRQALALTPSAGFPAHLQATVQAFWLASDLGLDGCIRDQLRLILNTPQ